MKLKIILFVMLLFAGNTVIANEGQIPRPLVFKLFNTLEIACPMGGPPDSFVDEDRELKGYVIDLWRLWSEKTGIDIELIPVSWQPGIDRVCAGKLDVFGIYAHIDSGESCLRDVFPLRDDSVHIFHDKRISGLESIDDLLGFRIGVVSGRPEAKLIREKLPDAVLAEFPNAPAMFAALKQKKIVVFLNTLQNTLWWLKKYGLETKFQFVSQNALWAVHCFVSVKKGRPDLAEAIRKGMAMITPSERAAIEREWLGHSGVNTEDTVVISMDMGYAPMTFLNTDGEPAGMFIDFWRLWSEKTGRKIAFHIGNWEESIDSLRSGLADVHSGLFFSEARAKWMGFSQPIYAASSYFFFLNFQTLDLAPEALKEKKLGAIKESYQERHLRRNYPGATIVPFPTRKSMIRAALDGGIHALLAEHHPTVSTLTQMGLTGRLKTDGNIVFSKEFRGGVLKENTDLLALIDQGFDAISNKELANIEKRWVPDPTNRFFGGKTEKLRLTVAEDVWLKAHQTVTVGATTGFPPLAFYENNRFKGILSDILDLISEKSGLQIDYVPASPLESDRRLKAKEIDAKLTFDIPERRDYATFTQPFIWHRLVIVARDAMPYISGINALSGKKMATIGGLKIHDRFLNEYPEIEPYPVNSLSEALDTVAQGKADFLILSLNMAGYLLQEHPNLKIVGLADIPPEPHMLAVRKDLPELVGILDKAIGAISDSERRAIVQKWFTVRVEQAPNWSAVMQWAGIFGIFFLVILGSTLFWNQRLRKEVNLRKRTKEKLQTLNEELHQSVQKLTALIDASPLAIIVLDPDGNVTLWNPAAAEMFGWKEEEVIGRFLPLVSDEKKEEHRVLRERVLNGEGFHSVEASRRKKDRSVIFISISTVPLRNSKGRINGIMSVSVDITERKRAEAALEKSLAEKEVLLREIHHRVKNNMQAISGLLRMQARRTDDAHLTEIFNDCRDRIGAMSLIHEALYQSENLGKVDFNTYLKKLCRNLAQAHDAPRRRIELTTSAADVSLDMDQGVAVGMVIAELISNTFKHAFPHDEGGAVSVRLDRPDGKTVRLVVSDTGIGLPEDFDIRNPSSLGMRLVSGAVTRELGGSIEATSDGGTEFVLRFKCEER
jgi:polar amino acid transport system substrate-binding protein